MKTTCFRTFYRWSLAGSAALFLGALSAQAHLLPGQSYSFDSGFSHPLHGLDHVLAMVAVGLWAAQLGGRSIWLVPLSFVSLMIGGGALGVAGVPLPFAETGILVSIFFVGFLLLAAVRLPSWAGAALVGLFAVCHGYAHGAEMPADASFVGYGLGFFLATVLLHGAGLAAGLGFGRSAASREGSQPSLAFFRLSGAAVMAGGLCVLLGLA